MINKRDRLYQVQKSDNEHDTTLFKKAKYEVDCKLKTAYKNYLNSLVGHHDDIDDSDTVPRSVTKKLFSFLKNCRQHSQATAPLIPKVNCIQTMSKKQTFWTKNFSLCLLQSQLWNSSSCVRKYQTFKTQVYTLLVIFHQVLTAITATFLMSVFQWMTFRSYYRTWNQTRPPSPDRIKPLFLQMLNSEIAPIL